MMEKKSTKEAMARRTHRLSTCDECCRVVIALAAALMSFACMFVAASLPTVEWLLLRMVPFVSSVPHRLRVALGLPCGEDQPLCTDRDAIPPSPKGCEDYNATCQAPCTICHSYAQDACARCSMRSVGLACSSSSSGSSIDSASAHSSAGRDRGGLSLTRNLARQSDHRPLRWLHFPKCGATFAVSILSYTCSEHLPAWHIAGMALRGGQIDVRMARALRARHRYHGSRCSGRLLLPFHGHSPVPSMRRAGYGPELVAMFRKPAQRLISAFLDNYHAWGLPPKVRLSLKGRAPTIAAFARFPGIAGCMAKMLAGHQCAAQVELRDGKVLRQALATLRSPRVAFVGLVEEWEASVCLFHKMLPGNTRPLAAEFRQLGHSVNSRRALRWLPPSSAPGQYNESVLEGFIDEADEAVYAEARRIFRRNVARFGAGG